MTTILSSITTAVNKNPMFKDLIGELSEKNETLTRIEANYLNKMTTLSYGTVTACLSNVDQLKHDNGRCNYDTLDQVFYALKNFTLNKLRSNVTYSVWQDCWNDFSRELVKS